MKKRLISAAVLLFISIPLIYLGGIPFYIFSILAALIAYREIINLIIKDDKFVKLIAYIVFLILIIFNIFKTNFNTLIDYRLIGICLLIFALLGLYKYKSKELSIEKLFALIGITIFLSTSISAIIIIRNISFPYFIYVLSIPILNDTFAHSVGTLFGKHKINEISPNKSWEGCIGGAFFGVIGSSILYLLFINMDISIISLVGITFILSVIGQLGDLFFSLIKRKYDIKDFGNLIPGHGGVLDRLDSLIFVSLAFTFFITFL